MTSGEQAFTVSGMQNPIVRVAEVFVVAGVCAVVGILVKDQATAAKIIAGIAVLASQYGVSLPKFGTDAG